LILAPYLNGGLFKEKAGYDDKGWFIPDKEIESFFEFLFSHSFTIEENSLDDAELQLNPEFWALFSSASSTRPTARFTRRAPKWI